MSGFPVVAYHHVDPAGPLTGTTAGGDGAMKELFNFEGLPQMVATSDLVIEGTVQKVEPGRVVGEGHGAIQFGQVTVSVNRVLFGRSNPQG
jgi:hypothetical protein